MVSLAFLMALAALLATPGPTNTLLLVGAAHRGAVRPALPLLAAETGAYLLAVTAIGLVVEGFLGSWPGARLALQALAAAYVFWLALGLWRRGAGEMRGRPVTPSMVAVATLSNPKAFIIALPLMPAGAFSDPALVLPHLVALALMVPVAGGGWVWLGVRLSRARDARIMAGLPRAASLALVLFSLLLARSAVFG
jgi:threonine/homoserine/homoserine lactone efflux protein